MRCSRILHQFLISEIYTNRLDFKATYIQVIYLPILEIIYNIIKLYHKKDKQMSR